MDRGIWKTQREEKTTTEGLRKKRKRNVSQKRKEKNKSEIKKIKEQSEERKEKLGRLRGRKKKERKTQ